MVTESLAEIAARHAVWDHPDPGHADKLSVHSYIPHYERLLAPYRDKIIQFLEIGLACGNSIRMWDEYFCPESTLFGIDVSIVCSPPSDRVHLIEADATKVKDLNRELGVTTFDIIIDDGSHMQADQEAAFRLLAPRVRPGGLYIIEDILSPELSLPALTSLHPNCEVIDLRAEKGRFDDVLIVYRFLNL